MSSKIVIAKAGKNAATETSPNNLKFSSDYGTLKYFNKLTASVTLIAGDFAAAGSVTHNLGYYPYVEVYVDPHGSGTYEYCPYAGAGATVIYGASFTITPTVVNLYVESTGFMSDHTFNFIVFIFKNNLNIQ